MIQSLSTLRQQFVAGQKSFHSLPADDPRTLHPLSLAQNKKDAKRLLLAMRGGKEWSRAASHPHPTSLTKEGLKLADAQIIIAREQGFQSWPRFKHFIEASAIEDKSVKEGSPSALDAEKRTLHIRCGSDVMYKLAMAGFTGDFLHFADPYIQGPVPAEPDVERFVQIRADFIVANDWRKKEEVYSELLTEYQSLEQAQEYERVAFWFEHDAYDILIFIKLLHFFSNPEKRPKELIFLCADHYPGVKRFNGIGQLPPQTMRILWEQFSPIKEAHLSFAKQCWEAFTKSTPEGFTQLLNTDPSPMPEIMPALRRHIRELPWLDDGLSLSERLTLTILAEQGEQDAANLFFHWYTTHYEPLVFMGDSSYWLLLDGLYQAHRPAITLTKNSEKPSDWHVGLSDYGRELLDGKAHWVTDNRYDRWFGGTHNQSGIPIWYWNEAASKVVQR